MSRDIKNKKPHQREYEKRDRKLRAIAIRCAKLMGPGFSSVEHGDLLYDERGLPK